MGQRDQRDKRVQNGTEHFDWLISRTLISVLEIMVVRERLKLTLGGNHSIVMH